MTFMGKWLQDMRRKAAKKRGKFEVFPQDDGEFGIRFRASNNQVTLTARETYSRDRDARRAIRNLQKSVDAPIVTLKPAAAAPAAGSVGP